MLSALLEAALQRWNSLAMRERRLLVFAAVIAVAALLFLVGFEPAWQGRAALEQRLPQLRAQAAAVERMANEARGLESAARAPAQSIQAVRMGIERSIDSAGLRESIRRLQINGAVIDLEVRQAPFGVLIDWLDATVREQRLRVVDVVLNRDAGGWRVSGRLLLEHSSGSAGAPGARP